jgi:hypothetical protein
MCSEPPLKTLGITREIQVRDLNRAALMNHGEVTGKLRALTPFNEERERRLASGLLDPRQSPVQEVAISTDSGTCTYGQTEPSSDFTEIVSANGPAEGLHDVPIRRGNPAPEVTGGGLIRVDDGEQLKIEITKRHEPVGRPPACVTTALHRRKAEPFLNLICGRRQVAYRNQYVVELQALSLIIATS